MKNTQNTSNNNFPSNYNYNSNNNNFDSNQNANLFSNPNSTSNLKKVAEYRLRLMTKKSEIKIGKINDNYNPERCLIDKEPNSKLFKLTEKKFGDEKTKFTGSLMAEQTSKYLIFNAKANSDTIEIYPAENWFMFKKDINYKTINSDEAEEKMKMKSHIVDSLKNKGPHGSNVSAKEKKNIKERKASEDNAAESRRGIKRNFDEDEEEDNKFFKKNTKENSEEIEEKDDTDLELKEMPSDLEEDFFGKKKDDKIDLFGSNQDEDESSLGDEMSDMFEKSKENSEVEDDLSEVERKFNEQSARDQKLLGEKRKNPDSDMQDRKSSSSNYNLIEIIVNLFIKHKKLSKEQLKKELKRFDISTSDIETKVDPLLTKLCSRFKEDGEIKYYLNNN